MGFWVSGGVVEMVTAVVKQVASWGKVEVAVVTGYGGGRGEGNRNGGFDFI